MFRSRLILPDAKVTFSDPSLISPIPYFYFSERRIMYI